MDYQQKAEALAALADLAVMYREKQWRIGGPEPWYCQQSIYVKNGSCMTSTGGNGFTPEEAIDDHWKNITELKPCEYLVVNSGTPIRRTVRWNGFMWADILEPKENAV